MEWYWQGWRLWLNFDGRASRRAYWMFFAVNLLVSLLLIGIDVISASRWMTWLEVGYSVVSFIPLLALTVRRLHDSGYCGWWSLIFLLPGIGAIVLVVLMALRGDAYPNQYGQTSPRGLK